MAARAPRHGGFSRSGAFLVRIGQFAASVSDLRRIDPRAPRMSAHSPIDRATAAVRFSKSSRAGMPPQVDLTRISSTLPHGATASGAAGDGADQSTGAGSASVSRSSVRVTRPACCAFVVQGRA